MDGAAVDEGCVFSDATGESEAGGVAVDEVECLVEVAFDVFAAFNAFLPFSEAVHLGAVFVGDAFAVGVDVFPADGGGESSVGKKWAEWWSGACFFFLLFVVEGAPFRTVVDEAVVEDEAAVVADEFCSELVSVDVRALALGAFDDFLGGLVFVLVHACSIS